VLFYKRKEVQKFEIYNNLDYSIKVRLDIEAGLDKSKIISPGKETVDSKTGFWGVHYCVQEIEVRNSKTNKNKII